MTVAPTDVDHEGSAFAAVLDAIPDGVLVVHPDQLRIEWANQAAAERCGRERSTLLGQRLADVIAIEEARLEALAGAALGRGSGDLDAAPLRVSGGGTRTADLLLRRTDEPGGRRLVVVVRDPRPRADAEARLRRLAEAEHGRAAELNAVIGALGDGVLVIGPSGRVDLANPAALRLVPGISTYDDLLAVLDDRAGDAPPLGVTAGPVEVRVAGSADRWLELSTYAVPARFEGSREDGGGTRGAETIVLIRDVTLARRGRASRETFVHMLSHELRTPITTIYGGAQVLWRRGAALDAGTREGLLTDIHGEAERLHRLVEDVIALTRFGEDETPVGVEPLLLQHVLPAAAAAEEARWPGLHVTTRVPTGLSTVVADRTYVEQVVRNLLSNAAKYAGPRANVEVVAEEEDGEVAVSVLDDGPGFGTAEAARLFDLYYRSPDTAASAGGAGIGLFVCARLVAAMGGRIWARRRDGRGAEFGFTLKVLRDEADRGADG